MNISVEITLSPLQENYEEPIINFIKALRKSDLKVLENPLSTQIYGEYHLVFKTLETEIKKAFDAIDIGLFHLKIVKTDRLNYERNY